MYFSALKKICSTVLVLSFLFVPLYKSEAQLFVPFGGYLVDVDYVTCSCGFIILTIFDVAKKTEYRIIHFYVAQVLERLGLDFGALGAFVPRLYEYGMIIPGYEVNVLGNFFPYQNASCLVISSTGCSIITPGANGYLYNMGTSLLPRL